MAEVNKQGNVITNCRSCKGGLSTYEWLSVKGSYGAVIEEIRDYDNRPLRREHRLFRCAGCGRGGLGIITYSGSDYPGNNPELKEFFPYVRDRLTLPKAVPAGIRSEFQEGEACFEKGCYRAAAGMFRSVLDKTFLANGYKVAGASLYAQIDAAATDGLITEARKRRAHEEVRVLGNDVLHDEWREVLEREVVSARYYCQRILEDFYDDRNSVLTELRKVNRVPDEDRKAGGAALVAKSPAP